MKSRLKILAFNTIRAPYRIDLYNELGKYVELTVFLEQEHDYTRTKSWYSNNFESFKMIHAKRWDKSLKWPKLDIFSLMKENKFDFVYMSEWSSITALLLISQCIIKKVPYIISIDGYIPKTEIASNKIKKMIKRIIAKNATAAIGTGKSTNDYAKSIGFSDERIFAVGFTSLRKNEIISKPIFEKEEIKNKLGLESSKKYILSVGQMVPRKGFDLLLTAWKLANISDEWSLIMIGDGDYQDDIRMQIQTQSIENVIVLNGCDRTKLRMYYQASEFFVLNTREDIWGLVINEAMANGLPILTTYQCVAGVEMVQDDINGYLYDCEDYHTCAKYIGKLSDNKIKREQMTLNNLLKIQDYTIEKEAKRIFEIICYLIEKKNI